MEFIVLFLKTACSSLFPPFLPSCLPSFFPSLLLVPSFSGPFRSFALLRLGFAFLGLLCLGLPGACCAVPCLALALALACFDYFGLFACFPAFLQLAIFALFLRSFPWTLLCRPSAPFIAISQPHPRVSVWLSGWVGWLSGS